MIPRFHRAVCDYFTFGSAPVPAITRAEKPVLNDSKFSPFPFRHFTCEGPRPRPDQSSGFSQSQSYPAANARSLPVRMCSVNDSMPSNMTCARPLEQIGQRGCRTAIRNVEHVNTGHHLEQLTGHVWRG